MEDRYLFRAKRIDNGEWAVGQYVNTCYPGNDKETRHFIVVYPNEYHEIYTSTICQCTGLKDKNGKLIWENDIVKVKYSDGFEEITEVAYSKNGYSPYLNEYECEGCCCRCEVTEIEAIGNIFDNAGLLESEG